MVLLTQIGSNVSPPTFFNKSVMEFRIRLCNRVLSSGWLQVIPFTDIISLESIRNLTNSLVLMKCVVVSVMGGLHFLIKGSFFNNPRTFGVVCQCCLNIETSQLTCRSNHLTGFYMRATLAFNRLIQCEKFGVTHFKCELTSKFCKIAMLCFI